MLVKVGKKPGRKARKRRGLLLRGLPQGPTHTGEGIGFDRSIELEGEKLRQKYPSLSAHIDSVVADFKERNHAGQFHDWLDTRFEFIDAVGKLAPRKRVNPSGKPGYYKQRPAAHGLRGNKRSLNDIAA